MTKLSDYQIRITIREDRAILLICMLIALLFWFFVKLSKEYRTDWTFSISYLLPENKAFLERPPDDVRATLKGPGWDLMYYYLFATGDTLVFDLEQVPPPGLTRRLLFDRMALEISSENIEAVDVETDYIPILLEDSKTVRLPVALNYNFELAPEHHLRDSIQLKPDSVSVTGPVSLVEELTVWQTDSGSMEGLKEDLTTVLEMAEDRRKVLSVRPDEVQVTIPIEPYVEKTFLFLPVQVRNAPDSLRIFPSTVTLSCVVGMSHYNDIDAQDFVVEANLEGFEKNSEKNRVPLSLVEQPAAVWGVRFTPQSSEFFFEETDSLFWQQNQPSSPEKEE